MSKRVELGTELFAVQAFFNAVPDDVFLKMMSGFVQGVGLSVGLSHCDFPGDGEPGDIPLGHVLFTFDDEETQLTDGQFLDALRLACASQVRRRPEQAAEIEAYLATLTTG